MKAQKKLSIMLSALLTLNLIHGSVLKANATEISNDISLKSVLVSEKLVTPGSEVKVTVDASDASAKLNKDASAVYVLKSGDSEVEKEVALALDDNDKKYHATISVDSKAQPGNWKLSFITVGDEAGNVKIFYNSKVHSELGQDLSSGDFGVVIDNDAPVLGNIALGSNNLIQGSTLNVEISATDIGVGLSDEANLTYVIKTDKGDVEKPLTLKLDGGKYKGSLRIDETYPLGDWKLSFITLADRAGNVRVLYNSKVHGDELGQDLSAGDFSVKPDTEAPKFVNISIDKKFAKLGDNVTVTVTATDGFDLAKEANLCYVMKTEKGDIEKGITLKLVNGKYQGTLAIDEALTSGIIAPSFVTLEDIAGNLMVLYNSKVHDGMGPECSADMSSGNVTVDMINPDEPVISLSTENLTNKDVDITITAKEPNGKIEYRLDGQPGWTTYTSKFSISQNTTIFARVIDEAGNISKTTEKKVTNIDKVAPVITITGVENGQIYNKVVKPGINIDDKEAAVVKTLNGNPYDDMEISEAGSYTLKVTATDKVGNVSEKVISFTVDKTAPTITINVVDGKAYNTDVKPEVVVSNKECTVKATLNDKPFNVGDKITAEGNYKLVVTVVDGFNRSYEIVKKFTIDKTKPVITISGIKDKSFYKDKVNVVITTDEKATITTTLNSKPFVNNEIAGEGAYTLKVTAVDAAGNISDVVYNFVIDKTAPAIHVLGLQDGGLYNNNVNPIVKIDDVNADTTIITLNSKLYDGKPITAEGSYEFKVVATDKAGNTSEAVYKFSIDKTAPIISVEGITDGKIFLGTSVVPTIKINETAKVTMTLDDKPYDFNTPITTLGDHKLTITAVDNAGNVSKKEIKFSMQVSIPKDASKAADIIKDLVKNAKSQDKVVLNATENPIIDAKVFEAIKGIDKEITVVVESQGITLTWTFNGKDVTDTTKSVDLSLNAVAPHKDLITKIDSNAQILSFKYHGTLPAPMKITIPVDTNKFDVSKPLYCYYYNETTKKAELVAEGLKAYKNGDAYFVDVTITHCSDYFLSASDSKTVLPKVEKLVQTGSPLDMSVLLVIGVLLVGTGLTVVISRRKRA